MKTLENNIRILRMKDLPKKIGFAPSTIYELVAKGKFPKPFKLLPGGRAAGWLEHELDSWLNDQRNDLGDYK